MNIPAAASAPYHRAAIALLVLLAGTIAIYWPGLSGPFLFDDAPNIIDNSILHDPKLTVMDWWSAAQSSGAGVLRRPLSMLSFALQHAAHGELTAFALKAGNLLIHIGCGALIYWLLTLVTAARGARDDSRWLPLLAAAVWLLNPLLVSTVLYPVQRMAQLSTLFVLGGLCSYAWYRRRWALRGARPDEVLAALLWLLLFTALAVASKENGLLLGWLAAVLEVTLLRGLWNSRVSTAVSRLGLAACVLPLLAAAALTLWQWDWVVGGYGYREFTLEQRLWTEARLLWSYLSWFSLPQIQAMGLFHDDLLLSRGWLQPSTTLLACVGWLAVIALGVWLRRRFPWLLFAVLFYLVGHSMESGLLALELVFEHRNYLPALGPSVFLAALLLGLGRRLAANGAVGLAAAPAALWLLLACAVLGLRVHSWSGEMALATANLARHPQSSRAGHFYANTLIKERHAPGVDNATADRYLTIARHEFERLQQLNPQDLSALVMLYTLDVGNYREVGNPELWLAGIEASVAGSSLKATEYAAMRVLLSCVKSGTCDIPPQRLQRLLDTFSARFAHAHGSAELQLQALEAVTASAGERSELMEAALQRSPQVLALYYPLISARLELGDYPGVHLALMRLLAADRNYRQLARVDSFFAGAPAASGEAR